MYEELFADAEARHHLPPGILRAVAQHESSLETFAMRWEPKFYQRYCVGLDLSQHRGSSIETERTARACSWGLMQVMGQVAREHGFDGPFLSELCDPWYGVEYGAIHLAAKFNRYNTLEASISAYNAGKPISGNYDSYVLPILERMGRA